MITPELFIAIGTVVVLLSIVNLIGWLRDRHKHRRQMLAKWEAFERRANEIGRGL